jgi:hypothetical protein
MIQYRLPIYIEGLKYHSDYHLFTITEEKTRFLGMNFRLTSVPVKDISIMIEGMHENKVFKFREQTDLYYYFEHGPYVLRISK